MSPGYICGVTAADQLIDLDDRRLQTRHLSRGRATDWNARR
jgi:hypothetical protein